MPWSGLISAPTTRLLPIPHSLSLEQAGTLPILTALYLLAAATLLLPWPFAAHPPWAYNWEGYTAWRWQTFWESGPSLAILAPTDGLMTDSGQGPLVGLPATVGVALAGYRLDAMRLPVALLAAASVPLLWLLGRRLAGTGPATLAALLLAVSPAFLVYGRTATLVGVSLVPLLLTALGLARVLDPRADHRWQWRREGALAATLLLGIYAYAPVRLLWPMTLFTLALAAYGNPARRRPLLMTLLLCATIVPAALMALELATSPEPRPLAAASGYFHARGEQLVAMSENPAEAGQYLRGPVAGPEEGWRAAVQLVGQNARDLARLLLDRDTAPVLTDYWNERGRFWPWFLFPFAAIGALASLAKAWTGGRGAIVRLLPLIFCLGLALPLLLTSRVHIGRLLSALPFALLLTGSGLWLGAAGIAATLRRAGLTISPTVAALSLGSAILVAAALGARAEMTTPLSPSRDARTAATISTWYDAAKERGGAVLVEDPALGDDIERVHAAAYRLTLDPLYRFVDLHDPATPTTDPRPSLRWHGALDALQTGTIPAPCGRLWFVAPEIADDFSAAWRDAGCRGAPDSVILP